MKIQLDENWSIASDAYSWVLTFSEIREREKVDAKRNKTGETEQFEHTDSWFYPKISHCLNKYKEETLKPLETVEQILSKLESIDKKIGNIKNDIWKKI